MSDKTYVDARNEAFARGFILDDPRVEELLGDLELRKRIIAWTITSMRSSEQLTPRWTITCMHDRPDPHVCLDRTYRLKLHIAGALIAETTLDELRRED